jgi:hypothetical protein
MANEALGNHEKAVDDLRTAIALRPSYQEAREALGE